ncbi:ethanolamine ammonia-lyase subunit EutB, partial [Mycobacterium kansasii]
MIRSQSVRGETFTFTSMADLLAKATPLRSGDELAGCAAASDAERAAAKWALAEVPLAALLEELVVPYESDEVTRL